MKRFKILFVSILTAVITLCGVIFAGCDRNKDGETVTPPPTEKRTLSVKTLDNADSDEKTHEITATEVDGVKFSWSINWENSASEWATGKTVTDYIEFTTNGYIATVRALQAFGERVVVSATWGEGNEAYTLTKSVDYALKCKYKLSDDGTYYSVVGFEYNASDIFTVGIREVYNGKPVTRLCRNSMSFCPSSTLFIPKSINFIEQGTNNFYNYGGSHSINVVFEDTDNWYWVYYDKSDNRFPLKVDILNYDDTGELLYGFNAYKYGFANSLEYWACNLVKIISEN